MLLIKNAKLYTPKFVGKKDILVAGEKIIHIDDEINITNSFIKIIDASKYIAIPGFIDKHVHITGGYREKM